MAQEHKTEQGTALRDHLTYRIARVQAKLNAQATRIVKEAAGITLTQWRVILLIGTVGRTRSTDVVREAAIDKGLVSRTIKTLTDADLVATETDKHDQRAHNLTLTAKGRELYARVLPITQERQRALRADLDADEIETLYQVLDKLETASAV